MTSDTTSRGQPLLSRRLLLAGLAASLASPALANAPAHSPRPQARPGAAPLAARAAAPAAPAMPASAEGLIEAARLGGRVTYAVYDARSGALLEGRDPNVGQPPASVAKAVTSAFALERLGAGYRFTTRLVATGPIQGGVLNGDLVLMGGGDPRLSTDDLGDMVAALRAKGLRQVRGRFLVNGSALPSIPRIDAAQPEHLGYNPAISGINLNFNRVHMEWKRGKQGWQIGMDARADRYAPSVAMASARIIERQRPLFTYDQGNGSERWTVASASLGKGGSRWMPIRQPEAYAGDVFRALCLSQGIEVPPPATTNTQPQGSVIAQTSSPVLSDVLRDMLKHSTNLTAEVMGLTSSGQGSLRNSAGMMNDWLRSRHGIEAGFVDHSGLGGASRISAAAMAGVLMRTPNLSQIMRAHPVAEKGQGPQVHAKTGTLNFVSGLAGYVQTARPLVFAIFAADTARRDSLSPAEMERPRGGPEWNRRARNLQNELIKRWSTVYTS